MIVSSFVVALALFGQALDPNASEQAYVTADPINADRLGLATPVGHYAIRPMQGCDGITIGQNVVIWPGRDLPPWLELAPATDSGTTPCIVRVEGRMDTTPCSTIAGQCDAAADDQ